MQVISELHSRFDWSWAAIICLGLLDAVLSRRLGIRFIGWEKFALLTGFPVVVAIYYRVSGRSEQLADTGYYISAWLVFCVLGSILTYTAARVDLPLRDTLLARFDSLLHFNSCSWASFVASHKKLKLFLAVAYSSILPQTISSVVYFSAIRSTSRNNDLLRTTIIGALITAAISGVLPAQGPHQKGQYFDWWATQAALRDGSAPAFSLDRLQGIIVCPSFHTVAAILLVYAHRPPLPSFRVVLILNCLMLLSIPSEGQHYLVDMIAGALVATVSIAAVRLLQDGRAWQSLPIQRRSKHQEQDEQQNRSDRLAVVSDSRQA